MSRPTFVRLAIFLATVVATWGVLSLGGDSQDSDLVVGQPAPQDFEAEKTADVVDTEATEAAKQAAREGVDSDLAREPQPAVEASVAAQISAVFDDVQDLAVDDPVSAPTSPAPELPTRTTTPSSSDESTTTTEPEDVAVITGRVFIDVDADGVYVPEGENPRIDKGIENVTVTLETYDGTVNVVTEADGSWAAEITGGAAVVSVQADDSAIPEHFAPPSEQLSGLIECESGQTCESFDVWFTANTRAVDEVANLVEELHLLPVETIDYLALTAVDDVWRAGLGEPLHLPTIRRAADDRLLQEFGRKIQEDQLQDAKVAVRNDPPLVLHEDTGQDVEGGKAAAEVVAAFLQPNFTINETELARLQEEAADEVPDVVQTVVAGTRIVFDGQPVTQFHKDAIRDTAAPVTTERASIGLLWVVGVLVALFGLYLARFRPEFWSRPRMVALLGILLLLAAGSIRATVLLHEATSWYILPAVAFGFVTAILFDQRIASLMALSVGVLTAAGTLDVGITAYGALAALAPIPFVSSVSTRGAFRNAVVYSALAAAVIAGATSWFFHTGPNDAVATFLTIDIPYEVVGVAMAWAFGVSVVAALLGLAALQFFESAFDITTTLSLLDLTDRNHDALKLLQEEAFGTFNHSLMVGTLADAAARSIGANPLLARAMAYYHDLGKTENPLMFIENQFGIPNPHDTMDPKDSAEVIRSHVTSGVALARKFKIPTDVTQGIVSHHGDGIMRYFYEKARELHGVDIDIDDYRHIGHKPRSEETAILMLADSLEAACRAVFQTEEPTPDAIEKVVDRIMDEKLEDGQLSESPLTLQELTKIRGAFLDSLVGHYHQRIAYPNFPGS